MIFLNFNYKIFNKLKLINKVFKIFTINLLHYNSINELGPLNSFQNIYFYMYNVRIHFGVLSYLLKSNLNNNCIINY